LIYIRVKTLFRLSIIDMPISWSTLLISDVPIFYAVTSGVSARVNFTNHADCTVVVYWHSYEGQLVQYAVLAPGDHYIQQTFVTHPWSFQDRNSRTLLVTSEGDAIYFPKGTAETENIVIVREGE